MLRSLLRRWFLENLALKMVAMVLAVTLFILVSGEKTTERSVRVSVAYIRPADRVLVSDVPDSVEVWVRGAWTRIKRVEPADVDPIVVDLTKRSDGDVIIDENDIRLPAGLQVASIRPAKITVLFEHMKKVPVLPELVGALPDGFVVERVAADPAALTVRGPKVGIDALVEARTLPVSIAGKRGPFHQTVALAPLPGGAIADADTVGVDVQITEEAASRSLPVVPVSLLPPAGSSRLPGGLEITPPVVSVVLRGGRNAVKAVDDEQVHAAVEVHIQDLAPGSSRRAPVIVRGTPPGVAVEVYPREISISMRGKIEKSP